MNMKKIISTILAAVLTVGVSMHVAFGRDYIERLSTEYISAEVEAEEKLSENENIEDTLTEAEVEYEENESEIKAELESVSLAGSGTKSDPYLISTAEQLRTITTTKETASSCYKLINDITLPSNWRCVSRMFCYEYNEFVGELDGAGYTIYATDFYDVEDDERKLDAFYGDDNIGIFDMNYGTIKNLNIHMEPTDKLYMTRFCAGVLCSYNYGTITNCSVSGEFYYMGVYPASEYDDWQTYTTLGGLVGKNVEGGRIENCISTLTIRTDLPCENVGGIVGNSYSDVSTINGVITSVNRESVVENCYSKGQIVAFSADRIGGIAGHNGGIINNCYSASSLAGNSYLSSTGKIGSIVGKCFDNSMVARVSNSYYYVREGTQGDNNIGTSVSREKLGERSTYTGWDFIETWGIDENINAGYPYLLWEYHGENIRWPDCNVDKIESNVDTVNKKLSVNTNIKNTEERSIPVSVVVSIFDEDDIYKGCEYTEIVLEPGNNSISLDTISMRNYDPQKKYYGKVMVWDSIYGISPVSEAATFEIQWK